MKITIKRILYLKFIVFIFSKNIIILFTIILFSIKSKKKITFKINWVFFYHIFYFKKLTKKNKNYINNQIIYTIKIFKTIIFINNGL